jgi:hypothetical protein
MELTSWWNLLVNSFVIFNIWPNERPSSLPPLSLLLLPFFFTINSTPPLILSQINFSLQIWQPRHSICQHPYSDSNFIEHFPLQVSKTSHFLFELNFKMLIFIAFFCNICILFECLLDLIAFFHRNLLYECMICAC